MANIVLYSYAKINLSLNVISTLENGYHELDMVICPISLHDEIILSTKSKGITIDCDKKELANDSNIAYKAAKAIFSFVGKDDGIDIYIAKNIWTEAGMGGGSSNAAAVLIGINKLYNYGLSTEQLSEIGIKLGADVPLFLQDGLVRVRGIGEKLEYYDYDDMLPIVILQDKGGLSTKYVFDIYDRNPCRKKSDNIMLIKSVQDNDSMRIYENMHNCLQNTSIVLDNNVGKGIDMLRTMGAKISIMTGSGSAVYGIFEDMSSAQKAYNELRGEYDKCQVVTTVGQFIRIVDVVE